MPTDDEQFEPLTPKEPAPPSFSVFSYASKYREAVARRVSRDEPLVGLHPKPSDLPPLARTLQDGPCPPLECFTNALGLNIVVYSWPQATRQPKAIVLALHGLDSFAESEYAKRPGLAKGEGYRGSWLEAWNRAGYLVYSFDYQGMGYSESVVDSLRSMCFSYDDYVDDAVQLLGLLHTRHQSLPIALLGASMGGCVAVHAAQRVPHRVAALLLAAPAIGRFEKLKAKPANVLVLPLLGCLSRLLPWLPVGAKHMPHDSPAKLEEILLGLPRFNETKMRARYCAEGLRAGEAALDGAHKLSMPLWVVHAPDDEMTDFAGSVALMAAASSTQDKTLVSDCPGDHNIIEADSTKHGLAYVHRAIEWLDQRVCSGRGSFLGLI